jgi:catechol 2,3-dioxygenase-like lactoylglutathione lyase family enzyme/predicted enzyme related to lactoylglutathione lyase
MPDPIAPSSPPPVAALRSVEVSLADVAEAERFFIETWRLSVAARDGDAVYLRGAGADHHLLALHPGPRSEVRMVTFRATSDADLDRIAQAVPAAGGRVLAPRAAVAEPGGGTAVVVEDRQGRILRFVHGDARHDESSGTGPGAGGDRPIRLAHAVLNSHDVAAALPFYEALGFRLSDRTRIMAFIRIPVTPKGDHHSIALADADNDCLNHIAFLMPDTESVMRGAGRMRDAGSGIEWGPGRHGPGNNTFNYFVGPGGIVIEYTAEVEQVDDSYVTRGPEEWKWPTGRVDHWGISAPPSARLKEAQRQVRFANWSQT